MLHLRAGHRITTQRSFDVFPQYVQTVLSCHGNCVFKYRNSAMTYFKVELCFQSVASAKLWMMLDHGNMVKFVSLYIITLQGKKMCFVARKGGENERVKRDTRWREILQHKAGATSMFRIWVVGSSETNVYHSFSSGLHSSGFVWFNQSS